MNRKQSPPSAPHHLLLVTHFFPSHGGGIEAVAGQLAREMLAQNPALRIEWFASGGEALPQRVPRLRLVPIRAWHGIEKKLGVPCPIWDARGLARLWRAVGACDAAHLHDFAYMGNVLTALFCTLRRKPFIVTQHIGFVPMKTLSLNRALEWLNRSVGVRVLNRAKERVFVSDVVRNYFEERGMKAGVVVANGVDDAVFHPVSEEERQVLRAKENLSPKAPVAIFAGRFVAKKGVPFVLELAKRTLDVQWILAGRGPLDPGDAPLPNVRVVRDRSGVSLADLFRLADVLVLPSRGEGFPLVVQEALACGAAVLVENSLARALPDVESWLCTATLDGEEALDEWVARLYKILKSDDQSARGGRANYGRGTWSWSECAKRYARLLAVDTLL